MTFLKHLRRAWREASINHVYDLFVEGEFGWTDDDDKRLSEFFASETGLKLKARLSNYVIRCAIEATRQTTEVEYHNGLARGVNLTVNEIKQHFHARPLRNVGISETHQQPSVADGLALN